MARGLRLRHLSFHGPVRKPAIIDFGPSLNVVYGASNTGKSFIVDTVDFMLGGKGPLRDLPERVGYDRILLAIETLDNQTFTLLRNPEGGPFTLYTGLFSHDLPEVAGEQLADQHNEKRDDNISIFLLSKLDAAHRRVRRNKRGDTQSLSFRNLARLVVVNEEEIIQQRSPLSDGSYVADTANTAVFKFLLTGVDDSALAPPRPGTPEEQSRSAQIGLLDQLIDQHRRQAKELTGSQDELEEQIEKLNDTIAMHTQQLAVTEAEYSDIANRRRKLLRSVEEGRNRLTEINSLLSRFELLEDHYRSDIGRLKGIEEAGSLFTALGGTACPLCGAEPEHHRLDNSCDGNVEGVVAAARAEIAKIELRQAELKETIATLQKEAQSFEKRLPALEQSLSSLSQQIEKIVAPNLRSLRTSYSHLADKRSDIREALGFHRSLKDLQERKSKLEEDQNSGDEVNVSDVELSTSTVDKFATLVLEILKAWHFPDIDRVHFDIKERDLIINGKKRTSYGKGLRAITQAAFTVGLLQYCRSEDTPHPGFTILDSPLLSYREPESAADDLRETDLNSHFYRYLQGLKEDRQVIVVENMDPPREVQASPQALQFTGLHDVGRFGLFPTEYPSQNQQKP